MSISTLHRAPSRGTASNAHSLHNVSYDGPDDEASFQKFARSVWRNFRGQYQQIRHLSHDCVLLRTQAYALIEGCQTADAWLRRLQNRGVHGYWAQDTFVLAQIPNATRIQEAEVAGKAHTQSAR